LTKRVSTAVGCIDQRDDGRADEGRNKVECFPFSKERIYELFPRVLEPCQGGRHGRRSPIFRKRKYWWHYIVYDSVAGSGQFTGSIGFDDPLHIVPADLSILEDTSHARKIYCWEAEKKAKIQLAWQGIGEKASVILNWYYGDAASDWE
jgi:hypothetical protein